MIHVLFLSITRAKVIWQCAASLQTGDSDPEISPFMGDRGPV